MTGEHDAYWHYRRFHKFALSKRALPETAEEFAAYAIEVWLRSKRAEANWLWVDFLRTQLGRDKRANGDGLGWKCERGRVDVTEAFQVAVPPEPILERIDARRLLHQVSGRTRRILEAVFWDGKTQREVGEELGITESRVSQILAQTIPRLRRKYVMDNLHDIILTEDETTSRSESSMAIETALAAADDTPTALAPPMLEPRSCPPCGGTFRVLISSRQAYCSAACEAKGTGVKRDDSWKGQRDRNKVAGEIYLSRVKALHEQGLSVAKISAQLMSEGIKTMSGKPASPANVQTAVTKIKGNAKAAKKRVERAAPEEAVPVEPIQVPRRPSVLDELDAPVAASALPELALTILESEDLSDTKKVRMLKAYAEI